MYYSEELKVYKKVGFVSDKTKRSVETKEDVEQKFKKLFEKKVVTRAKFSIINGVPHKRVNGKLVPLTRVES
jgi:uncharacterized protein (DUF362 family)